MALQDHLLAEKASIIALLEAEYADQNLREQLLERLFYIRQLLGELAGDVGSITVTGGDASAANQTNVQANAGTDASKALSIQGITGGKALDVNVTDSFALETGGNLATIAGTVGTDGGLTPSRTLLVGGVHDSTIQTIKVDSQGRILLNPTNQQTKADSVSVTMASDQGNLGNITNITGTISLPTGAATSANQSTANNSLGSLDGKLTLGAKTAANSLAVTLATDGVASGIANQIGEVQASPTANTVLARLKAIADALVFGIKNAANSISIAPASDATFTLASEAGFLTVRNTALTNTAVAIKASAGSLMGWNFINVNTSAVYVKFYDLAAASVVVGTTPVKATIAIPAGSATNPAIFLQSPDIVPFEVFTTAISFACVTELADNSNTAPATAIHASVRYK